jgi:hypothetical protein
MGEVTRAIFAGVASLIGLAILSVVLSNRSNTASVISTAGNALSSVIGAATGPITGAQVATTSTAAASNALGNLPFQ